MTTLKDLKRYRPHESGVEDWLLCEKLSWRVGAAIMRLFHLGEDDDPVESLGVAQFHLQREAERVDTLTSEQLLAEEARYDDSEGAASTIYEECRDGALSIVLVALYDGVASGLGPPLKERLMAAEQRLTTAIAAAKKTRRLKRFKRRDPRRAPLNALEKAPQWKRSAPAKQKSPE